MGRISSLDESSRYIKNFMSQTGSPANGGSGGATSNVPPAAPVSEIRAQELVKLTIDGKSVSVPKGTNLIEAARMVGIDVPYYCYHPHLSIAGNCRMCQVKVKGAPKLDIGCNTVVKEGMEVATHHTSKEVDDAQAATLEFILINHPLDCTVCDQAGHCKLQDYHWEYNARPSRFLERKEHKVKAEPLGPTVMLDGERCIMCTRCIRFCDEITQTSELGMLNRGDRSVIAINPGKELNNPLSGTVVDLCPVGALTHRNWRFNTRIWFTKETDTICTGCSTGCSARVAVRDREVVQVKGRLNSAVNKEWMCDEGRYGFNRFLPEKRLTTPSLNGAPAAWEAALRQARAVVSDELLVFVAPDLLLEEYAILKEFLEKSGKRYKAVLCYHERPLTKVEALLVSPDYAPNFRGAEFVGLVAGNLERDYLDALGWVRGGSVRNVIFVGERCVRRADLDEGFLAQVRNAHSSVAIVADADSPLVGAARVSFPGRTVLEKSGLMLNRNLRLQFSERVVDFPTGSEPEWRTLNRLALEGGLKLVLTNGSTTMADRDLTLSYLSKDPRVAGLRIPVIKGLGVDLRGYRPGGRGDERASDVGAGATV